MVDWSYGSLSPLLEKGQDGMRGFIDREEARVWSLAIHALLRSGHEIPAAIQKADQVAEAYFLRLPPRERERLERYAREEARWAHELR